MARLPRARRPPKFDEFDESMKLETSTTISSSDEEDEGRTDVDEAMIKNAGLTDDKLTTLSIVDLNSRLKGLPKDVVKRLKERRRTLKNRGYAKQCRTVKEEEEKQLRLRCESLREENKQLNREREEKKREIEEWRLKCEKLEQFMHGIRQQGEVVARGGLNTGQ